jgi:hypothetical protein
VRSLISFDHFQQLCRADPNLQLISRFRVCNIVGQNLEIVGQFEVTFKIQEFSWSWVFLVSRRLWGQLILGADFVSKSKMVLELRKSKCHFDFVPSTCIKSNSENYYPSCSKTMPLYARLPQVQTGKLSPQRGKLEQLINQYPDVVNSPHGV